MGDVCVSIFSLDIGTKVTDVFANGFSAVCKTAYAGYDSSSDTYSCATAPKSNSTLPVMCNIGEAC